MRPLRVRFTVRRLMIAVAIAGLLLGVVHAVRLNRRAKTYRRHAEWCAVMERRCRQIDAMDDATRAREAEEAFDDPYLDQPEWNRRMISYFASLKLKYRQAASTPWLLVPPDPPNP